MIKKVLSIVLTSSILLASSNVCFAYIDDDGKLIDEYTNQDVQEKFYGFDKFGNLNEKPKKNWSYSYPTSSTLTVTSGDSPLWVTEGCSADIAEWSEKLGDPGFDPKDYPVKYSIKDTSKAEISGVLGAIFAKKPGDTLYVTKSPDLKTSTPVRILYRDVTKKSDFWYNAVYYLTNKGVVEGYKDKYRPHGYETYNTAYLFKPGNDCTRAQMVTFLWRLSGKPNPKSKTCTFTDVKSTDYFYKAVIWATEQEITTGISSTKFGPQGVCTRAQTVTFLWRMAGKPEPKTKVNKFPDIKTSDYFYKATLWASERGILAGLPDGTFNPQGKCLRRQMVTFLYKYDKKINKSTYESEYDRVNRILNK